MGSIETNCNITMRDVGNSAQIASKSVWVYGDTLLAIPNEDDSRMLTNTQSSTYDTDAGDGLHGFEEQVDDVGAPLQFLQFTEEEAAFNEAHWGDSCSEEPCNTRWALWPGTIVVDSEKARAYFFYGKVYVGEGHFNFDCKGRSIAVWKTDEESGPKRQIFNRVEGYPTLMFSQDEPRFGSAAVVVNERVYVYGCSLGEGILTKPCKLARVSIDHILDRDAWEYYQEDGTWSKQMDSMGTVMHGNNFMSVLYNDYLGSYLAIYSEPLKNHIMIRTARSPEGPWSAARKVWTSADPQPSGWIYDALAHPEYSSPDDRQIYVTHSLPTGVFKSDMKLLLVELTLEP
jgi:hypothetical protein